MTEFQTLVKEKNTNITTNILKNKIWIVGFSPLRRKLEFQFIDSNTRKKKMLASTKMKEIINVLNYRKITRQS
jgi:hypothetical protein